MRLVQSEYREQRWAAGDECLQPSCLIFGVENSCHGCCERKGLGTGILVTGALAAQVRMACGLGRQAGKGLCLQPMFAGGLCGSCVLGLDFQQWEEVEDGQRSRSIKWQPVTNSGKRINHRRGITRSRM